MSNEALHRPAPPSSPVAYQDELAWRVALHYKEAHEPMSDGAFDALLEAVQEDMGPYLTHPSDRAFALLAPLLDDYRQPHPEEELLSNEEYYLTINRRRDQLIDACDRALKEDPRSVEAQMVSLLLDDEDSLNVLARLNQLEAKVTGPDVIRIPETGSAWDDIFSRPYLRLKVAIASLALESACYRQVVATTSELLRLMPSDELGMRHSLALALARLEDEKGFDELDALFGRHGSPWSNLARTLLLFKLDRMAAARRALQGFLSLSDGAAFALLRPVYLEPYLPLRPSVAPGSFEEVTLAVREADPVVVDVPEFVTWVSEQPGVQEQAARFAQARGYDF